jgi:hypothetical protein
LASMMDIAPKSEKKTDLENTDNKNDDESGNQNKNTPENQNDDSSEDELELEDDIYFLNYIYLQKSPYKINGKFVEQIREQIFLPIKFIDAIKDFESGQVYSVLTKDENGNFNVLNQNADYSFAERVANLLSNNKQTVENVESGYLIYIVTQEVVFNEEISKITYFKDITFGVLYEQVKA